MDKPVASISTSLAGVTACLAVGLALWSQIPMSAADSGWVEDDRPTFRQPIDDGMPPTAPEHPSPKKLAQGNFLTGSAQINHANPTTSVPLSPRYLPAQAQAAAFNLGNDADRFLMGAKTDTVVPPQALKGWLDRTHPGFNLSASNDPMKILEVKGAWDNSAEILKAMGIRHRVVKPREVIGMNLQGTKVVIINCEGKMPRETWEPLRQWVINGGYLISTDWTLHGFVENAFPGMVAWSGVNTPGKTVDALPIAADPTWLKGITPGRVTWKLDEESQMVRILRPESVHVLARSYKLAQMDPVRSTIRDPNQWGVLACEFQYGRGHVLHLVGHFDYNSPLTFSRHVLPDAIPGAGIGLRQVLATNFLVKALQSP